MLERESAIRNGLAAGSRLRDNAAGVSLGEVRGWNLLQVAGFGGTVAAVEVALAAAVGVAVPSRIGKSAMGDGTLSILRAGPDQFWLIGTGELPAREAVIRSAITPGTGVVTSLSHSRTRIFIEGSRARDVLAKEIAIDLDPVGLGVGTFVLCGLDHTPVLLHHTAAERFELFAPRSFALSVWQRLADAALEWGYEVAPAG
jgi:methylglutamate dehydrogenase subunit D